MTPGDGRARYLRVDTTQHELAELVRQLAREGSRDHEVAEVLDLDVNDVRRILGLNSREAA